MVLAVEIIVCCLIFGIYRVIRIKRDPAYKISNMPEKLQKKGHAYAWLQKSEYPYHDRLGEVCKEASDTYILDDSACHTDIDSRGNKLFNGLCVCAFDMDGSSIVS